MNSAQILRKLVGYPKVAEALKKIRNDLMRAVINHQTSTDTRDITVYLNTKLSQEEIDVLWTLIRAEGFSTMQTGTWTSHNPSGLFTLVKLGFETAVEE